MRDFITFCGQVVKRCFTGIFLLLDFLGLILLLTSKTQPKLPWQLSLAIFAVTIYIACFSVWKEQKEKTSKADRQLKDLKDKTPEYTIETGEIKKYTVKPLVEKYAKLVSDYAPRPKTDNVTPVNLSPASGILSIVESARQMAENLAPAMRMAGIETPEEKHERFSNHLAELQSLEKAIKNLYQIEVSIQSTRADKNIEISVTSLQVDEMIVDDDYVADKIPTMQEPSSRFGRLISVPNLSNVRLQSKLYLASYGDHDSAFSKLSSLNAKRQLNLFDEDFFINTPSKKVKMSFKIHSEGRDDPQIIDKELDLSGAIVESLDEGREED